MDASKILMSVKTLNDYVNITQDLKNKYKSSKILHDVSIVLHLKNIRSLEIAYFNKYDDSGAAFIIFKRMLQIPPSKSWSLLGKELVLLIQYWLDAVRKQMITHHPHWWTFLKGLLGLIKELKQKEQSLCDILVKELAGILLDLATNRKHDADQIYEILHPLNIFCAESSREMRLALRPQLQPYFIRLSLTMASCNYLPTQYSIIETLVRWLLPRHDERVRQEAAAQWFPPHVYHETVVDAFLQRSWVNFLQDAREFLNAYNGTNKYVMSALCKKLTVGELVVISGNEKRSSWLDLNVARGSMTVQLDPHLLNVLGAPKRTACETLVIPSDSVIEATLYRESGEVMLSVMTIEPPLVIPSMVAAFGDCGQYVNISISSHSSLPRTDAGLRVLFQHKYQVQLDLEEVISRSPGMPEVICNTDEETRFSHAPVEAKGRYRNSNGNSKPLIKCFKPRSTTSTTSRAQLHEELAALPQYEPPPKVRMEPQLSCVIEVNEDDITSQPSVSTRRLTPGVKISRAIPQSSQSDGEIVTEIEQNIGPRKVKHKYNNASTNILVKPKRGIPIEMTVNKSLLHSDTDDTSNEISKFTYSRDDDYSNSLVAFGIDDESATTAVKRLPKEKAITTDSILDQIMKDTLEAQANEHDRALDSGINTGEGKRTQDVKLSEAIENTLNTEHDKTIPSIKTKQCVKGSLQKERQLTDESNTDAINEAPISYVNFRTENAQSKRTNEKRVEIAANDVQTVDFFSQHRFENKSGNLRISPKLARKINETSSESSEDFNYCIKYKESECFDLDVVECLNSMVDKVCIAFENYTQYLHRDDAGINMMVIEENINVKSDVHKKSPGRKQMERGKDKKVTQNRTSKRIKSKTQQNIKLKSEPRAQGTSKSRATTKNNFELEHASKLSIIPKASIENKHLSNNKNSPIIKDVTLGVHETNDLEIPLIRRKRKLYSPNSYIMPEKAIDDEVDRKTNTLPSKTGSDDITLAELKRNLKSVSPKVITTCQKESEKRLKLKNKKQKKPTTKFESDLSPKSKKKNDAFDNLRNIGESGEKIVLADVKSCNKDIAVYNYTSDSEDEDFKKKKLGITNRISSTTLDSRHSVLSTGRGPVVTDINCTENDTKDSATRNTKTKRKTPLRKRPGKRQNLKALKKDVKLDPVIEYEYEKMRDQQQVLLNTSLSVEKTSKSVGNKTHKQPEPAIVPPTLEVIYDESIRNKSISQVSIEKKSNKTTERSPATKSGKGTEMVSHIPKDNEDDRTMSPLPGLVVEKAPMVEHKGDDSLTSNMVRKIKKMYQDEPDTSINITNTTQNLLSDDEKADYSVQMNILEEFDVVSAKDKSTDNCARENPKNKNLNTVPYFQKKDFEGKTNNKRDIEGNANQNKLTECYKKKSLQLKNKKEQIQNDMFKQTLKEFASISKYKEPQLKTNKNTDSNYSQTKTNRNNQTDFSKIYDLIDVESEHSISTVGITGHCNSNESPPNLETLNRQDNIIPRKMEDMDESSKAYYIKLMNEAECHNLLSSDFTTATKEKPSSKSRNRVKAIAPVVYVERLSPDKLSIYSKQSCENREKHHHEFTSSTKEPTVNRIQNEDRVKKIPSKENVQKQSPDKRSIFFNDTSNYHYLKSLPSLKSSNTEKSPGSNKRVDITSNFSPTVSITRMTTDTIAKLLHSPSSGSTCKSLKNSNESTQETPEISNFDDKKRKGSKTPLKISNKLQSIILPIQPFKASANRGNLQVSTPEEECVEVDYNAKNKNTQNRGRENMFYSLKRSPKIRAVAENVKETPIKRSRNLNYFRSLSDLTIKSSLECDNHIGDDNAIYSDDEPLINTTKRRKSSLTYHRHDNKKPKQGLSNHIESINIIESEPTVSSVDDWLDKNQACSRADGVHAEVKDTIINLNERIDVTLNEIQRETSNSFIQMFVDVRKSLAEMKEEINTRIDTLHEQLSSRASHFIREDCEKKRVVVKMMREDLQAVLEGLEKIKDDH